MVHLCWSKESHVELMSHVMSNVLLIPSFQNSRGTISLRARSSNSKSPATQVANRQVDSQPCLNMHINDEKVMKDVFRDKKAHLAEKRM